MTLVADRRPTSAPAHGTIAARFGFGPGVRASLSAFRTRCTVVRLASLDNERLGVPRWYTLAEAWATPGSAAAAAWSRNPVVVADASDPAELVLATGTPVVVIGEDIAGAPWQRAIVDAVRSSCERVLVVDMGPTPGQDYADVATFGHDVERGHELIGLLTGS